MDKDRVIKMINTYWRFDNDQDNLSTWHDKQDLINKIEQLNIPVVSKSVTAKDLKCPSCKKHCLITYIYGKECTSCGYVC